MSDFLDSNYWEKRFKDKNTPWDIGYASKPFTNYFANIEKHKSILIPGAGNGYEAIWLLNNGFTNITIIDIAKDAVDNIKDLIKKLPKNNITIVHGDYFLHHEHYDYIYEQTFFCALPPSFRPVYVKHTHKLLHEKGKLIGVLFNKSFANKNSPPFGGNTYEYKLLFEHLFLFKRFEHCNNSIPPRGNTEWFIEMEKKALTNY